MPTRPELEAQAVAAVRGLARASRHLERASTELKLAHYRVLSAVASGDERASRIAARLALGKPTISAAVDSLSERGLLTRSSDDDDQRVAVLQLTPEGRLVLESVETAMIASLNDLCARSPDPSSLLRALVWLGGAVDEAAVERHRGERA